ncbi:Pkinase-domain-containing protein [Trametes versicolor FP-101664 SS1]|uniref:Pkinase-domain-containing protein n=1 Tax=Trametes versicolor (strain FP-101664) TaxID=717944 RepID=UPI0004621C03|nr:Pkinase-domain-containing protein [Trametes versicolor FP-101664 SS1]EIW58780.1 Pkinase-domain-containing protein [Trametes versicolor FP-101664 SS1]
MAAAVAKLNISISKPLSMVSQKHADPGAPLGTGAASSSRLQSHTSEAQPKTFSRLRSSLEQSLRTATKSKAKSPAAVDESGVLSPGAGKGKGRASEDDAPKEKEKARSRMLSKVSFRRPGRDVSTPSPVPAVPPLASEQSQGARAVRDRDKPKDKDKVRLAGHTSFLTPSLRQASMSSPTLHLSAQPIPSSFTQPFALPSGSTSNVAALVSPPRDRTRRSSAQPAVSPKDISGPTPLAPRRDLRSNGTSSPTPRDSSEMQRPSKQSRPPPLSFASSPTAPSLHSRELQSRSPPPPETPTRRSREATRSPDLSPPSSPSPRGFGVSSSRRAAASASHLPLGLGSPPSSPTTPRATSPTLARSSSRTPTTHRNIPSAASTSHLPLNSASPSNRRPSLDSARPNIPPSPSPSRAASPVTPARTRAVSPTQRNYSPSYGQNRLYNASTTSLAAPANPEHRELIRSATAFLCREMLKPPAQFGKSGLEPKDWEEVEVRLRALARVERIWTRSGAVASSSQVNVSALGNGVASGSEEKERRLFGEALRDGYVLCQCLNKLFPNSIARVDRREDGFVRTSNVTKFLAACSTVGLGSDKLFHRDDLIEATSECLARVAKTVIALSQLAEFPPAPSNAILGGSRMGMSPYGQNTRAAASTPNLSMSQLQRSTSPVGPSSPGQRKRWSPHQHLPTVRSDSPNEDSSDGKTVNNDDVFGSKPSTPVPSSVDRDEVPPMVMTPPPRSPLRVRPVVERISIADSTRASVGDSVMGSMAESFEVPAAMRQSQASSNMTDSTNFSTAFSSLLDPPRSPTSVNNKFGTIRTVTTEATSESPSMTRTEGSSIAPSFKEEGRYRGMDSPTRPSRERRPSETAIVDLSRVVEESEDGLASTRGARSKGEKQSPERARSPLRTAPVPIKLGKGKWPDDFLGLDTFQAPKSSLLDDDDSFSLSASVHTPLSISPPRSKLVIAASRSPNESVESLPQFSPRRPTHRARHSVDTPGLLPKDALLRRDSSPDAGASPSRRVVLRRSSSKAAGNRNGIYIPHKEGSASPDDSDAAVPFPRSVSGEHSSTPPGAGFVFPSASPNDSKTDVSSVLGVDRPRLPRGRFQSEIDAASSRRKPRPNSYDELGAKPRRSRFESMVNLGVASSNASASDLMSRDSLDGSGVRQTLIVREDGKAPTQFQLGNCIGRGQFGAVYRALNLNTGQMVAVKRIRLEGLKEDEISQLMREVDLVKSLSHPSIVKYEGMARDDTSLNIVLEYAENGSLGQTLKAFGKLNERLVANYVVKILEGLHYLHQNDVVHCDLKAANILTTKNGNVKLSDFGVSLNLRAMEREMKDVAGTPNWMAPEVIELKGASTKSDIWSLACTVIELLTGRPPYADIANSMSVMFRIVEDERPPLPEECSENLQSFLKWCFNKDPTKRPNAEQLCEHEWLKKHSAAHKELRPQDSIPFLRRVSADMQKSKAIRYLADLEMPDSDRSSADQRPSPLDLPGSPPRRRLSNDPEPISPREHSFVKTTFGKPVICRVCLQSVKKSAVLCEQCSLIAHARCSGNAPPTCDLRSQLLLYAQYAENGSSSPMDILAAAAQGGPPTSPTSQTSDDGFSRRTSMDSVQPHTPGQQGHLAHPPTAFKVFAAFKRSKSSLTIDQDHQSTTSLSPTPPVPQPVRQVSNKRSVLHRKSTRDSKDRPQSISSNSTSPNSASMRSAVTAAESMSSNRHSSHMSGDKSDRLSRMTSFSAVSAASGAETERDEPRLVGGLPPPTHREKRRDRDSGGCSVQ